MKILLASMVVLAAVVSLDAEQINELTDDTFDSYLTVSRLAIVDFYAPWCRHCQNFAPIYKEVVAQAQSLKLNMFFAKCVLGIADSSGMQKGVSLNMNLVNDLAHHVSLRSSISGEIVASVNCAGSGKNVCKKLKVRFLPTVRVFHDGKPLGDYNGVREKGMFYELFEESGHALFAVVSKRNLTVIQLGALLQFLQKASSSPNELKMTMSDAINSKIPSDVTPWNPEKAKHD